MTAPTVTIVSCYYALPNNKNRSLAEYQQWIATFLHCCTNPIVMFSDGQNADAMDNFRKNLSPEHAERWLLIRRPYTNLPFAQGDWAPYWQTMLDQNDFKHVYQTEIFVLYANKTKFLKEIVLSNPFKTTHFYWCDAGCWRNPEFAYDFGPGWPTVLGPKLQISWVGDLAAIRQEGADFKTLRELVEHLPVRKKVSVGGAIFGGPSGPCLAFADTVQQVFDLYKSLEFYGTDDQCVLATAAIYLERAGMVENLQAPQPPPGGDPWFALQYYTE